MGTKYHKRCVGNSPEFMPLDNSLNYDLKLSHRYHCAITAHLDDNSSYSRWSKKIWEHPEGAPITSRMIQDVYKVFEAFKMVYEADGNIL